MDPTLGRYKLTVAIFIESETDPEEVASTMDVGLGRALESFPIGEVVSTDVLGITNASDEEVRDHFEES